MEQEVAIVDCIRVEGSSRRRRGWDSSYNTQRVASEKEGSSPK